MMPYIYVLGISVRNRVLRELQSALIVLKYVNTRSTNLWEHETPNLLKTPYKRLRLPPTMLPEDSVAH